MTEATSEPNHDAAGDEPAASHDSAASHRSAAPNETDGSAADPRQERVLGTEILRRGRYLEFRVVTIERSDGRTSTRDIVGHPGAVAIVALDPEDRLLLVRQFRLAAGRSLLELPAGTLDVDAVTGEVEQPDLAAARELEEETGYRAGNLERIGEFWTAPGFATELMTLYLATDLRPADEADRLAADEDELLDVERLSLEEALDAVDRGEICDAKSIVGVLQLARRRAAVS